MVFRHFCLRTSAFLAKGSCGRSSSSVWLWRCPEADRPLTPREELDNEEEVVDDDEEEEEEEEEVEEEELCGLGVLVSG